MNLPLCPCFTSPDCKVKEPDAPLPVELPADRVKEPELPDDVVPDSRVNLPVLPIDAVPDCNLNSPELPLLPDLPDSITNLPE